MKSPLCQRFGIEFPLFAFSHCRDVVAAVTNAGGFGVLGAVMHTPKSLEVELAWIDEQVKGKPYGIDLLIPNKLDGKDSAQTAQDFAARAPPEHRQYVADLLQRHGIDPTGVWEAGVAEFYGNNMRAPGAPDPLPMPLRQLVSRAALEKVDKLAESGHRGAKELAAYYVGQAVGLMEAEQSVRSVVMEFMQDYAEAVERLTATVEV